MSSNMLELETARVCGTFDSAMDRGRVNTVWTRANHCTDLSMQDGIYPIRNGERMRLEGCGCSQQKQRGQ